MINKKFTSNVVLVVLSNLFRLISSIAGIFILPLMFSKQVYGFYKLFLLYTSYVGFCHFGLIDGIYLHFGGSDFNDLPKGKFRFYSKFLFYLQMVMSIILLIASLFIGGDRKIIILLVTANIIALNCTSYYQFISQITGRFREFANRNMIFTAFNILLIALFYIFKIDSYIWFLIITTLINYGLLIWYVITYRGITFGKIHETSSKFDDLKFLFKLGIPLLLSNIIINLVNSVPKQFVEMMYPIEQYPDTFAIFSFAFTLMGFATVFLAAIGLVVYPTLKKTNRNEMIGLYHKFNALILGLLFIAFSAYFPVSYIVSRFISQYKESLPIFYIMMPSIAITSAMTVVKHNYYKTLNMNKSFLLLGFISIIIMILMISGTYFFIEKSIEAIAIASLISIFIWYFMTDIFLTRKLQIFNLKNTLYLLLASLIFYSSKLVENLFISFFVYVVVMLIFTGLFYIKELKQLITKVKEKSTKSNTHDV